MKRIITRSSFTLNGARTDNTNIFAGVQNVEGALGINGVSTDPFDFGVPTLSFTNFSGLRDNSPLSRHDLTWSLGENASWNHGKHNVRFGADFRRIHLNLRTPTGGFQCLVSVQQQASANIARAGAVVGGNLSSLPEVDLQIRGWRSLYYGEKEPALSFAVETTSRLPVRFVTVLSPADVVVVKLDGTGVELRSAEGAQVTVIELANGPRIFQTASIRRCT